MTKHLPAVGLGPSQKGIDAFRGHKNRASYRQRPPAREQLCAYLVGIGNGRKPVGGKI
jgi:hypothetical protein